MGSSAVRTGDFFGLGLFAPWSEPAYVKVKVAMEQEILILPHIKIQVSRDGRSWVRVAFVVKIAPSKIG